VATVALRAPGDSLDVLYLGLGGVLAAYQGARIVLILGERGRALELLRSSIEKGLPRVPTSMDIHLEPIYDPLRGDTLFERLNRGKE
jgi:hypothetical protein